MAEDKNKKNDKNQEGTQSKQQIIKALLDNAKKSGKITMKELNLAIGFICHDIALVASISDDVAVMYLGNLVEVIPGKKLGTEAQHPYTKALMGSLFDIHMDFHKKIESLKGDVPSPLDVPEGCPFQERCVHCMETCRKVRPALQNVSEDHQVACHLYQNIKKACP